MDFFVLKKDGTIEAFDFEKIVKAVSKSASRVMVSFSDEQLSRLEKFVARSIVEFKSNTGSSDIPIETMHFIVEAALDRVDPEVARSYRDYRNYKQDFVHMLDDVYRKSQAIRYIGDRDNANTDSALVPTQRSLIYNELNSEFYKKFFLTRHEREAMKEGYIYIHDRSARLDTMNCFRRDTRFITEYGMRSFYDFSDGDTVMVMTHLGRWKKATVHKYGHQQIQKVTFKQSTHTSKERVVYCTPNHRWILSNGEGTTDLRVGDNLYRVPDTTEFDWDSIDAQSKKLWCMGFALGDGSISAEKQGYGVYHKVKVRLCGDKSKYSKRFVDAGYSVTCPTSAEGDCMVTMNYFGPHKIPFMQLNYENILYFVNGFMCADGNKSLGQNPSSQYRGVQVTGMLNDFIYDWLNMSRYFVTSQRDLTESETNFGQRTDKTISYKCSSSHSNTGVWRVVSIEADSLNPKSEVWCLEVEDDHSFILEGGIPTGNCCLANITEVLDGGFEMGNVWYNEPKTLDVAFDVISDVAISMAAMQYGGYTMPRVDTILAPYAEKSYQKYKQEFVEIANTTDGADEYATKKVRRDFEQGFQAWEYRFNTVGSSRGDYPFVAVSFGIGQSKWEKMASEMCLRVRMAGQGAPGKKKPVLFPKLTFLFDHELHGPGKSMEWLFDLGLECSSKCMYPDFLSLTGEGYIPSMYKKYGAVISLMGCRASLSPWYERGGMSPEDENDKPVFEGRFNMGAISLHLPMILAKARQENKDFYEVLDYYLELIRHLHKRTYDFLGEKKASINPLGFCEGGFYGGHLDPEDKIRPILAPMTMSFGITALNELQQLYNGKSIVEDGEFAIQVMEYINKKAAEFKEEDKILYAIYGTPAESLCGLQVEQFRKKYGIIKGVSDRPYVSNSFHCGVWENITPIEKQDAEGRFWNLFNGGKIQYCRYPVDYNMKAIKTLVLRAMDKGFYEGVNLSLAYCENCGYEQLDMDKCPECGSDLITKIDRMNGLTN